MTAMRLRALTAIVVMLVTAVWVLSAKPASTAPSEPTVANYLVRIARAMGLEGRLESRAPIAEYLRLLVQHGAISADAAQRLRIDQSLTRDLSLEVSSRISDPHAPSFLSKTYVVTAFLASHGRGVGLVRDGYSGNEDRFRARTNENEENCATPNEDENGNNNDNGDNDNARHAHHDHDHCPEE